MRRALKIASKFSNIVIASAFIIVLGGLVFFYSFPFNVAEFKKINIASDVQAGGQLQYDLEFCRYVPKGTPIQVSRFLIAKDKSLTNPIELSSNPTIETLDGINGCRTSLPVKLPVEISVPEGEYQLLIRARYCIEFTIFQRCIPVEQTSKFFNITKPSIPDRLSVISDQLNDINDFIHNNPDTVISNTVTPQSVREPVPPVVNQEPQTQTPAPQAVAPETPAQQSSNDSLIKLKSGIIDLQIGPLLK